MFSETILTGWLNEIVFYPPEPVKGKLGFASQLASLAALDRTWWIKKIVIKPAGAGDAKSPQAGPLKNHREVSS